MAAEAVHEQRMDLVAVSAGGGLSIPYQADEPTVDTRHYFEMVGYSQKENGRLVGHPVQLEIEPGRYLVADSGVLLTEVRATKQMGTNAFVMVDAGFQPLDASEHVWQSSYGVDPCRWHCG